MYYVYVLKGEKKHYVGYTGDLERRINEHKRGNTKTVNGLGKRNLIGFFQKETELEAQKLEKMIKKNGHIEHRKNHKTFIKTS